jgi:hypothetical protein
MRSLTLCHLDGAAMQLQLLLSTLRSQAQEQLCKSSTKPQRAARRQPGWRRRWYPKPPASSARATPLPIGKDWYRSAPVWALLEIDEAQASVTVRTLLHLKVTSGQDANADVNVADASMSHANVGLAGSSSRGVGSGTQGCHACGSQTHINAGCGCWAARGSSATAVRHLQRSPADSHSSVATQSCGCWSSAVQPC